MSRNLLDALNASLRENAALTALRVYRDGAWQTTTYRELDEISTRLAGALLELGLTPGDRVAVHAGNSPEWSMIDLACLKARLVSVPVYTTSTPHQIAHVLRDSGAALVFSGTPDLLAKVDATLPLLASGDDAEQPQSRLRRVLMLGEAQADSGDHTTLAQLLADAPSEESLAERLAALAAEVDPEDIVTIIYTSGTTGEPKGVLLPHRAYTHQLQAIDDRFDMRRGTRNMSFLPLTHAYERAWTYVVLANGMENCSVTNPKTVAEDLIEIRPSSFVSVPRLYEKVYAGAHAKAGSGAKRHLFDWALRVGGMVAMRREAGLPVSRALAAQHAVADRLVLHNVRDAVGGPKNVMAAGGAPLRREVEEFFLAAGLHVYQGYGLTETAPLTTCNAPGATRFGTVGTPVPGSQVRIAAQTGEILVKGDNVMSGYHGRPDATAEAIDADGWLHTGDVGYLDRDGYLVITDRIKDLIVTTQGKNIAPGPIESALCADPLVEAALVVGDVRPYLTALIQPSFEELEGWARARSLPFSSVQELLALGEVEEYYDQLIGRVGQDAAKFERVQKFRLLDEPLSMDAGELTPTLKVKRRPVEHRYAHLITDMYEG